MELLMFNLLGELARRIAFIRDKAFGKDRY